MQQISGCIPFSLMDSRNLIIVAELTGCFRGREEAAFGFLQQYVAKSSPQAKILLAFNEQLKTLPLNGASFDVRSVEPALDRQEGVRRILSAIEQELQNVAPGVEIDLVSFVGEIEEPFIAMCGKRQITANFVKWGELFHAKSTKIPDESVAMVATRLSRDEIVDALRQVVQAYPRGVRLTGLRNYLKPTERFSRELNPATAYNGFISNVVAIGVKAGVVRLEGISNQGTAAIVPPDGRVGELLPPGPITEEGGALRTSETTQPPPSLSKPKRRVDAFLDVLKSLNFGPFSRDRSLLFKTLEITAGSGNYTPAVLIRTAIDSCKRDTTRKTKLPWGIVERFFYTVLGQLPVLIGESGEILRPNAVESLGKKVQKLADGYAERIEKEMLFLLVQRLEDVRPDDMADLAFVLYPDRPEAEALTTIEMRLGELQTEGRISKEGDKFLAIGDGIST